MDSEFSRKKALVLGVLTLVLVGIPVTVYSALQQQDSRTKASEKIDDNYLMLIDDEKITEEQIKKVAEEQTVSSSINEGELASAADKILERKILDKISRQENINASSKDIEEQIKMNGLSRENAKYEVLRELVIKKKVKNWQIESVRFWIPSDEKTVSSGRTEFKPPSNLTDEEARLRLQQLLDVDSFLNEAENLMKTDSALNVAQTLAEKYPSLSKIIAVNNNLLLDYDPLNPYAFDFETPVFYTEDGLNSDLYANEIRSMKTPGEIKKVRTENNGGGAVFKLVNYNQNSGNSSYDDLLKQEKAKLRIINKLAK